MLIYRFAGEPESFLSVLLQVFTVYYLSTHFIKVSFSHQL